MKGLLTIGKPNLQSLKEMALSLLFILALCTVGWLSFEQILTVQASQSQIQATNSLEQQVVQLRSNYLQAEPDRLKTELNEADILLFQNFTHLTQWGHDLQEQAKRLDLQTKFRILKTEETGSSIEGVILVPVEIQVLPQGTNSAYQSFLKFVKTMTQSGPRVDIQDMTILGNGKKATVLKIGLSVWMKATNSVEL
ncbi:MAG: hypothetical protein V3T42_03610 [Nitrospirales bacterium]|jgi:hypothetical protein